MPRCSSRACLEPRAHSRNPGRAAAADRASFRRRHACISAQTIRLISGQASNWVHLALSTPVVLWAGWPCFVRAWASVRNRSLNRRSVAVQLIDAELASDRPGRGPAVPGEHDDTHAGLLQKPDRFGAGLLDGIGDADERCETSADGDEAPAGRPARDRPCAAAFGSPHAQYPAHSLVRVRLQRGRRADRRRDSLPLLRGPPVTRHRSGGHALSSVSVIANALRLRTVRIG